MKTPDYHDIVEAWEKISNEFDIDVTASDIHSIVEIMGDSEYYQGEIGKILEDRLTPETFARIAASRYEETEGEQENRQGVIYAFQEELQELLSVQALVDKGFMTYDDDRLIQNEIDNSYLIELNNNEYIYGEIGENVRQFAREWDDLKQSEQIEFLDNYTSTSKLDQYINQNFEDLDSEFNLSERFGDSVTITKLEDDEKLAILSRVVKVTRDDIESEISDQQDLTDENIFYVIAKLEESIIDRNTLLEDHIYETFGYAIEGQGIDSLSEYFDWNEDAVLEAALDNEGGYNNFIELSNGSYIAAGKLFWSDDQEELVLDHIIEANPELVNDYSLYYDGFAACSVYSGTANALKKYLPDEIKSDPHFLIELGYANLNVAKEFVEEKYGVEIYPNDHDELVDYIEKAEFTNSLQNSLSDSKKTKDPMELRDSLAISDSTVTKTKSNKLKI
ncbi:TPA: hypothetical protein QDB06_000789 [Burkholderia vietnamiensis]|nr:hypothetical protein [Burkholderia vietnamiensis]